MKIRNEEIGKIEERRNQGQYRIILLAILVYLVAAVFTKAITREEIVQLPKGEKLADKLHLK